MINIANLKKVSALRPLALGKKHKKEKETTK